MTEADWQSWAESDAIPLGEESVPEWVVYTESEEHGGQAEILSLHYGRVNAAQDVINEINRVAKWLRDQHEVVVILDPNDPKAPRTPQELRERQDYDNGYYFLCRRFSRELDSDGGFGSDATDTHERNEFYTRRKKKSLGCRWFLLKKDIWEPPEVQALRSWSVSRDHYWKW